MEVDLAGFVDGVPERFVPDVVRDELVGAQHRARYWWVGSLLEGRRVLDAGCGTGYGSAILAERGASEVVGVDIAEPVVEAASALESISVRFEVGDVRKLQFEDGSFDAVVSFEVIEHVVEQDAVLDEFARVLRPRGLVAVSSPNTSTYPAGNPHHTRELLPDELEEALGERFEHVRLYRQGDWITSAILDDAAFEERNGSPMQDVEIRKIAGRPAGNESYTVALASNVPLEDVTRLAVLTEPVELRRWLEHYEAQANFLQRQADHIVELETLLADRKMLLDQLAEAEHALSDRAELARQVQELEETSLRDRSLRLETAQALFRAHVAELALRHVVGSASWRLTAPLRAVKRLVAGPLPDLNPTLPRTEDEWEAWLDGHRERAT